MDYIEIIYLVFISVLGLVIGSFLNVVIYRVPNEMSIVKPASHCPDCNHPLAWYDNIPVFAYLFLGGKCRYCHKKISLRYMLVELLTGALFAGIYIWYGLSWLTLICILLISCFIAIFFIDNKHYIIPDSINLAILIISVAGMFWINLGSAESGLYINYADRLMWLLFIAVIFMLFRLIEKMTNKEIIGGGDIKLLGAIGLFLGWQLMLFSVLVGCILAIIIEIPFKNIIKRPNLENTDKRMIPFGPYLVVGFTIALLFGTNIINWYLNLFAI